MTRIIECRSCGSEALHQALDLGETPLANSLLAGHELDDAEPTYPLELLFCSDCTLLQISETVDPEELFREYVYFSSYSDTMVAHAKALVDRVLSQRSLGANDLVVELASNDGYLLQFYKSAGVPVLGIEPAANVAASAVGDRGIETLIEFFNLDLADRLALEGRSASVIHANNVLAHVADLRSFVSGIARLLRPNGVAILETPYVREMLDKVEFDTIYHEHLCYYSVTSLMRLLGDRGLKIVDVEPIDIHGGSIRIFAALSDSSVEPNLHVEKLLAAEQAWGVADLATYQRFGDRVRTLQRDLLEMLTQLRSDGARIAAYGAAAKGSTLLNCCRIGKDLVDYVVDRSPHKQGLYMPGVRLPIRAPAVLNEDRPDYALLLTWNFAPEILEQQADYIAGGGKFIVPVPVPEIVPK